MLLRPYCTLAKKISPKLGNYMQVQEIQINVENEPNFMLISQFSGWNHEMCVI